MAGAKCSNCKLPIASEEFNEGLNPSQRGDELCLHCHRIWKEHNGKTSTCPHGFKTFESSGRIDIQPAREVHNHESYRPLPICTRPHRDDNRMRGLV